MENPVGWLYRVAFNLAKRRWRLSVKRLFVNVDDEQLVAQSGFSDDRAALTTAIARLPYKQRAAVVLRYVLGYSTEEAADMLDLTEGALRVTLHRACGTLRLDPQLEPPSGKR